MAMQIRDLLRYDLFGECVRSVSSIPIDNNHLLTPKSLQEAALQSDNHNVCNWAFERVAELLFGSIEWALTAQSEILSVRALPCSQND